MPEAGMYLGARRVAMLDFGAHTKNKMTKEGAVRESGIRQNAKDNRRITVSTVSGNRYPCYPLAKLRSQLCPPIWF
jgi:hypothetical protein